MSAKPDSWLPLYVADYKADTARFSTEQHGAYLLIIMDYWRSGPPPDDDRVLAQITGLALAKWKAHRSAISPKFQITRGVWKHKRIDAELEKAQRKSELARDAAYRRHGKTDASAGADADADACADACAEQDADGLPKGCSSPSPTQEVLPAPPPSPPPAPSASAPPRKRGERSPKTALPADFAVSERVTGWARSKGFDRLDEHLESFVSKVRQHGYRYVDWDEAFMTAVREDWARLRNGHRGGNGNAAAIAEAERRLFGPNERDITGEAERI